MKTALITGVTGQDGAYLTELLLEKGYYVYGAFRRTSTVNFWRLDYLGIKQHKNLTLVEHDLTDLSATIRLVESSQPDEIYNLAAQSFVGVSFSQPLTTSEITGLSVTYLLEAIRIVNPKIKFYQASTSEMFGKVQQIPQNETTPFYPRSPYGVAKLYAHWMAINYRESYDMFATSGILFNHESPLRGKEFVTRKITDAVAKITTGKLDTLMLGNLAAERDWGYAKDYVDAMWRMMQLDESDVFVIATGKTQTVRKFVEMSFAIAGTFIEWSGAGENEVGICSNTGKVVVAVDPNYYRPAEVDLLIGSAEKAKQRLSWEPKTSLESLCTMMVESDLKRQSQ